MIQLYVPSIFDASEYNIVMNTPLMLVSRPASAKMVVGDLHRYYCTVDEEDALWHTIPCS
jgi:hypothetical protein